MRTKNLKKEKARKILFDIATPEERLVLIAKYYDSLQDDMDELRDVVSELEGAALPTKITALTKVVTSLVESMDDKHEKITRLSEGLAGFKREYEESKENTSRLVSKVGSLEKSKSVAELKQWMSKRLTEMSSDFENLRNLKPSAWGGSSRMIYNNSTGGIGNPMSPRNIYSDINLIMGSGLALTAVNNVTGSWVDVTISVTAAGGSTLGFETPVGLINSSNATYTVSHVPLYIILNGATYFENDGYTRSSLTITMLIVPQTGSTLRSAYNS